MARVDRLRDVRLEVAGEGGVEILAFVMFRVKLPNGLEGQALHPEAVLQRLRYNPPWRAVLFQLDHVQVALAVNGQQVDALAEIGDYLSTDLEEVAQTEDLDTRLKDLLQALLAGHSARRNLLNRVAIHPPQPEFHRHRDDPSGPLRPRP